MAGSSRCVAGSSSENVYSALLCDIVSNTIPQSLALIRTNGTCLPTGVLHAELNNFPRTFHFAISSHDLSNLLSGFGLNWFAAKFDI